MFALYTREDAFGLICETQDDLDSWLEALLNEQRNSENFSENGEFNFSIFKKSVFAFANFNVLFSEFVRSGLWDVYRGLDYSPCDCPSKLCKYISYCTVIWRGSDIAKNNQIALNLTDNFVLQDVFILSFVSKWNKWELFF